MPFKKKNYFLVTFIASSEGSREEEHKNSSCNNTWDPFLLYFMRVCGEISLYTSNETFKPYITQNHWSRPCHLKAVHTAV